MTEKQRRYKKVSCEDKSRIFTALKLGENIFALSGSLTIKYSTVKHISQQDYSPVRKHGPLQKKLTYIHTTFLRERLDDDPTLTLKKLQEILSETFDVIVSRPVSTVHRHLDGMDYSLRKLVV